jgi:hypothetical protein
LGDGNQFEVEDIENLQKRLRNKVKRLRKKLKKADQGKPLNKRKRATYPPGLTQSMDDGLVRGKAFVP